MQEIDVGERVHQVDGTKERRGSWEHNSGAEKTQGDLISMLISPPPHESSPRPSYRGAPKDDVPPSPNVSLPSSRLVLQPWGLAG